MQSKTDFNYLNQSFMTINTNLYEISDFELHHFGDSTTTLKMLSHYSKKEPNISKEDQRPDQLLLA